MPIVVTVYPLLRDWTYRSTICKSKWFRVPWIVTLYGEVLKRNETKRNRVRLEAACSEQARKESGENQIERRSVLHRRVIRLLSPVSSYAFNTVNARRCSRRSIKPSAVSACMWTVLSTLHLCHVTRS